MEMKILAFTFLVSALTISHHLHQNCGVWEGMIILQDNAKTVLWYVSVHYEFPYICAIMCFACTISPRSVPIGPLSPSYSPVFFSCD